jgi:hypothetical protein
MAINVAQRKREGLHNKLAIEMNRITMLNSGYDLLKFLFS